MKLDTELLGERLIQLREAKSLSLSATADSAGIAKSYLAKLERGEVENPGLKTLDSVAKALDVTLADLLAPKSSSAARPATSESEERERLLAAAPRSLREFLQSLEESEGKLPLDVVRSLATLQFRGKRPQALGDWQFVYEALKRSTP